MKQFPLRIAAAAGLALILSQTAFAADKKAPPKTMTGASATMLANTCAGCHGTGGSECWSINSNIGWYIFDLFHGNHGRL